MTEAEIRIAQKLLPRDWTSLREVVLKVIDFFGGPRGSGLAMVNRYLHEGLLELALVAPDSTMTEFLRKDCEHRTIHAPLLNPAEGVRVEPYEAGHYLARLAELTSPAERVEPGRDVDTADVPVQGTQVKPEGPRLPPPAREPASEWDPRMEWSVETVFRELRIKGRQQKVIVETLPKIYGDDIAGVLDRLVAKAPWPTAELCQAIGASLEAKAGKKLRGGEIPSWDACKDFLTAWHERRARRP
jgi:hypothetical protein